MRRFAWILGLLACRPPPDPPPPPRADPVGPPPRAPLEAERPPPSDPLAGMDGAARLAWAAGELAEVATLVTIDARPAAFATFASWFSDGAPGKVYLRAEPSDACLEIEGAVSEGTFVGRADVKRERKGKVRHESWMQIEISAAGIDELGLACRDLERGRDGAWHEVGVWGTGDLRTVSRYGMTHADDERVEFRTYAYRLEVECSGTDDGRDRCIGGGTRACPRCLGLVLVPHADGMGWGHGRMGAVGHSAEPIDCSNPCPPDEWTPLIEPMGRALAGHTFYGTVESGAVVYRTRAGCLAAPAPSAASD